VSGFDPQPLLPLWRVVHQRLGSGRPVTRVRVTGLTDPGRVALADLLGLDRLPGPDVDVTLGRLEQAVRAVSGRELHDLVTQLVGPVENRAARREDHDRRRAEVWTWLERHPVVRAEPSLADWAAQLRRAGLVNGSPERTRSALERTLAVLDALPGDGLPLPVLADRVLGDPHALDEGHRVPAWVLRAVACRFGLPYDPAARRELWERSGVACDALSSTVLVAGLCPASPSVAGQLLRLSARAGEAAVLTLVQVRALVAGLAPFADDLWAVENPSVLALAADRFGPRCPPIVCLSGWPSAAGMLLLRNVNALGTRIHYHGDLDGDGVRIAAHVLAKAGAGPWRMGVADYRAALRPQRPGPPVGRVTDAPWDAELAPAMQQAGTAVMEESVAEILLAELAEVSRGRPSAAAPSGSAPG
jgi:uncharacterized protein (TIGR02679 family)